MSIPAAASPARSAYGFQLFIIGIFFFIFGFITWANGTLIPYLSIACDLKLEWQAYLVTFAFYISYTILALPSSFILRKTGMVKGMQLGLVVMAIGCLVFVPSAMTRNYLLFLTGLFVIGAGLTMLQTASNPYVTILGPPERAAQRMSIMGVCNKGAGMLAPVVLGAIIFANGDNLEAELKVLTGAAREARLDEMAHKVIMPYVALSIALIVVAFLLRFAHLPEIRLNNEQQETPAHATPSIWKFPAVTLGFIAIFFSVAVEVIAGDTIGRYGLYHGFPLEMAVRLTSYTLFCMIAGYLIGVYSIPKYLSQEKAFLLTNILGIVISLLVIFMPGKSSVICLAALGLANAMLWPAIWPTAIKGLPNRMVSMVSAILIMGIAGGAVLPLVYGWLSGLMDKQMAYWILLPGYLFNIYYWNRCMTK